MTFHVTMLDLVVVIYIQYVSLDNKNNLGKIQRKKKEAESSLDLSCFVTNVTPSNLRYDSLGKWCRKNVWRDDSKGKSWTVDLKRKKSCPTTYIKRGWRSFCNANGFRAGSFFTFKLFQRGATLGLRLFHRELEEEAMPIECLSTEPDRNQNERSSQIWKDSSSPSQNRFVTPYNIRVSKLVRIFQNSDLGMFYEI
ncbi:putative transcription factor B3-Domain family [Arabidopsis thaliana]